MDSLVPSAGNDQSVAIASNPGFPFRILWRKIFSPKPGFETTIADCISGCRKAINQCVGQEISRERTSRPKIFHS